MCRFVMCAVSYASMGLVVSWFFGPTIPSSSNLAWTHYRGAGGGAAAEVRGVACTCCVRHDLEKGRWWKPWLSRGVLDS
jgi:hypothetical protein